MKKEKNEILVLMSTYNGEKYLKTQIESIENQKTDIPINILIRDDGSIDNTLEIIRTMKIKYGNIELIEGKNIGCNASFFELFKIANNYKYYAISDQDDVWLPNKLQTGIDRIKNDVNYPSLFGSCSYLFDGKEIKGTTQKQIRPLSLKNTIIQNIIPGHSQVFNSNLLKYLKNDIDISYIYVYDFWISNIAMTYGKIYFDNTPFTKYRIHSTNTVGYGKNRIQWFKERIKRISNGDGKKIYKQIFYFYETNKTNITDESDLNEIKKFIYLNSSFFKRIKFVLSTKLYRQKTIETLFFKIAYLFGKY